MDRLPTPSQTPAAEAWLAANDRRLNAIQRVLLGTIDGRRNIIELESIARAMGLEATALERLRGQGLIEYAGCASNSASLPRAISHHGHVA